MSLFENRQAVNLRACEQMVETVLTHMGVDPAESRLPRADGAAESEGPSWGLTCGSAHLFVFLTSSPNSEDNYIHVVAPVFRPPDEVDSALWRRLLELNGRVLTGAAFGLRDGEVVVTTDRSTQDLDRGEVEDMIRRIGDYADLYDDALVREFGGVRHCDLESRDAT
jgi:hypothetical protein